MGATPGGYGGGGGDGDGGGGDGLGGDGGGDGDGDGGGDGGAGCEFMWPFCATPLYVGSQPLVLNLTLLNSRAAVSHFARPPRWIPAAGGGNSGHIEVSFTHAARVAPWSGTLGVRVRATAAAAEEEEAEAIAAAGAGAWSGRGIGGGIGKGN